MMFVQGIRILIDDIIFLIICTAVQFTIKLKQVMALYKSDFG